MARTFVEAHIDLPAIEADLAAITPPVLTLDDLLDRLRPQITAASRRGATHEQIRDSLKEHGITVSAATVARIVAGDEASAKKTSPAKPAKGKQQTPPAPASSTAGTAQGTLA